MDTRRSWAIAGAALLNPVAAMFWLDLRRGRRPAPGLVAVGLAGALCAAAGAGRRNALPAGLAAAGAAALAGVALDAWVAALDRLEES